MKPYPGMTVGAVLDAAPASIDVFKRMGFGLLANPILRRMFAGRVTLDQACRRHGVKVEELIAALGEVSEKGGPDPQSNAAAVPPSAIENRQSKIENPDSQSEIRNPKSEILPEDNVSEVIFRHPVLIRVFERYFGGACFSCPAFGSEDIEMACRMHGVDPAEFTAAADREVAEGRSLRIDRSEPLNEIVRKHPATMGVFARAGMDACCGGALPLDQAAQRHGIHLGFLLYELDRAAGVMSNES